MLQNSSNDDRQVHDFVIGGNNNQSFQCWLSNFAVGLFCVLPEARLTQTAAVNLS
jgi:hypothetical protein